jgi:hypothetical protein
MRKIEQDARRAFLNNKEFKCSNTKVRMFDGKPHLYLHDNLIAKRDENNKLLIRHCGWETPTTMSRLNSLPGVRIRSYQGSFILNELGYMKDEWYNIDKL